MLKADEQTVPFSNRDNIQLNFRNQLAKIRVLFRGEKAGEVTNFSIEGYTECTHTEGTVSGSTPGEIKFKPWPGLILFEANVVPGYEIKKFKLNDGEWVELTKSVMPEAGKLHDIIINVGKEATVIDITSITETEYTVSGNVHLKGNGQAKDLKFIMNPDARLTIEDVVLEPTANGNAITCQGNATITLKGENSLTGGYASGWKAYNGIRVENGTLTINGDNQAKLTATGEGFCTGIGAANHANITINGGNIIANSRGEAAGIGSAGWGHTCGTINGGIIEARGGGYSAGIGGSNSGDIIITGGNISAYGGTQSSGISNGHGANCGNITSIPSYICLNSL